MTFKLVTVLALFLLVVQVSPSSEHLVHTNCRSSYSCRTFNDYANDADTYFISDSSFHFMKGTHHLNVTLFITNVVNLSFVGDKSDIILSNGCSIIWKLSSKISWISLNLFFNLTHNNSAVQIENSKFVSFSNSSFKKLHHKDFLNSRAFKTRSSSSIVFENCKFENGYHLNGGALNIEGSNVTFRGHNDFWDNAAYYSAGAIYGNKSNIIMKGSSSFLKNKAGIGRNKHSRYCGGAAIQVELSNISLYGYFKFCDNQIFGNVVCLKGGGTIAAKYSSLTLQGIIYFFNNSNIYGGAISLHHSAGLISGHIEFAGNRVVYYGGAIIVVHSSLIIQGDEFGNNSDSYFLKKYSQSIIFTHNSAGVRGGAVELYSSNMTLTGSVIFMANKARYGGGISMLYMAEFNVNYLNFILFQEPLDVHFYNNVANKFGGALYVFANGCNKMCVSVDCIIDNCFFKLNGSISYMNLIFTENQASQGGPGIYGGGIQYCQVEIKNQNQYGYSVLQGLTKNSSDIKKIYASFVASKIRICNGTTQDDFISIRVQKHRVYNISVEVLGEFDAPVYETVAYTVYYRNDKSSISGQPYNNKKVKGCRNLGFSVFSEHHTVKLILHTSQWPTTSIAHLVVIFLIDDCPPGFMLTGNACKCQASLLKIIFHQIVCNSSTALIKCPQHDWMKPILYENLTYQGFMWSPNCPSHLCRNDKENWLNFSSDNVDFLCLEYRAKMLCGACLQNYSLTLSSLRCSKCNSNNYLSLLLVFALAGVALIASLLLLRITVADGTINGLIFYANIFDNIDDILLPQNEIPPYPLTLFISWLNLDFGIPTCFFTGLNYYSYTWLQFVFPFYLWFLVGLIILACKYSSRAMKLFGSNPVAVLATVVLMSYNKLLHTSQEILPYVTVYYSNGTQEKRWKMDPSLLYFQGKHLPLAMFGLTIVIVFLLPYFMLLSFGHYLQKYSNKRRLKWLIKIKPILDAYYAPYCKNTQYWVGFLLFTRVCLSITYSALPNNEHTTILVIVSSVLTGVALIPWLQHKIYEKNFVNVLEGSFILNIIVLSITSDHIVTRNLKNYGIILSHTLISIAFIEFLAILGFHAWHRLNLKWLYMKYRKNTNAVILSSSIQCAAKVKDIDKSGENASTSMIFSIREPLLDDSTEL